jgi:hypothetical protein
VVVHDEDDEEELPAGFVKVEDGVKVERDDDLKMKEESDREWVLSCLVKS